MKYSFTGSNNYVTATAENHEESALLLALVVPKVRKPHKKHKKHKFKSECPICGKAFKSVKMHMTKGHPFNGETVSANVK